MQQEILHPTFTWQRWRSEAGDLAALPDGVAARMLFDVLLINRFELALLELKGNDAVWGPVHTSVGQEATAAGVVAALRPGDQFAATYRSHHQFLAKALQFRLPAAWNPAADELPEAGLEVVRRTMAEIMGLAPGYCRRARRVDAPALRGGGVSRRQRYRGRRAAAGGGRGVRRETGRQRQRGGGLRGRRRPAPGRLARGAEHGRALEATADLLYREQPVRRRHESAGGLGGAGSVGARRRLRHGRLHRRRQRSGGDLPVGEPRRRRAARRRTPGG